MSITSDRVSFTGRDGSVLAARLDRPVFAPVAYALFAHCFTCSKDVFAAARISTALAEEGIAVLRFDFTGLGSSEGDFANTNFSSNVDDLVAAAEFLRTEKEAPKILIGHSLGGAAVLAAAGRISEAEAVVTVGAPCGPEHVRHLLQGSREGLAKRGEMEVAIGGRVFRIQQQFLDDLENQHMIERIGNLRRALLVMHAPLDQVVGVDNARRIFETAKHPKSFVSLDGADHLLTRRGDARYAALVIAAWASRYIEVNTGRPAPLKAAPGEVVVAETGEGAFTQAMAAGRHAMRADEPEEFGGTDTGPSPYDLLMAALGACTSMTMRMYAQRKGWSVGKIMVRLTHQKIHAQDCEACETETGKIDRFEREITLPGELDEEQRARLLEIADRCPVHRTLHSETVVETRLVD